MTKLDFPLMPALEQFPRVVIGHLPTPLEAMANLGRELGLSLFVKRDDCTGIGFGGDKVRQLEYHLGAAHAEGADVLFITGAVQSNFVRTAAAMGRRVGMKCHIQLEERVPDISALYRTNGNVLLDKLLGATLHSYPAVRLRMQVFWWGCVWRVTTPKCAAFVSARMRRNRPRGSLNVWRRLRLLWALKIQ